MKFFSFHSAIATGSVQRPTVMSGNPTACGICMRTASLVRGPTANAPLSRVVVFRAPGRALRPFFRFPSNEGNGAPGGAGRFARPPWAGLRDRLSRRASGTQCLRAVGVPGRAGPCEEPCASWRSIRGTRCRRPHLAPSSGVAIDDAVRRARHRRYTPRWASGKVEDLRLQGPSTLPL